MQTKINIAFVLIIVNINLYSVSGYPTTSIREKLISLRSTSDKWMLGHSSLLELLFNKTNSPSEDKRPYDTEELLANCKNVKGEQRLYCVTSYMKKLYPDIGIRNQDVRMSTTSVKYSITTTTSVSHSSTKTFLPVFATTSTPNSASPTKETPRTNFESRNEPTSTKTEARNEKADDTRLSSAVLIVPGDPKIITSIIQDTDANISFAVTKDAKIKPITCRKDEFGFTDDVDPKLVDIASDMLCSLCKYQGDSICIVRWCFNITPRNP